MSPHVLVAGILFSCAAVVGLLAAAFVCARVAGHADGPEARRPPLVALVAGAALIGGVSGAHADALRLGLAVLVTGCFVAIWYCDMARGIVPDPFTLGPLAVFAVLAIVLHDPRSVVSAAIVFIPFAAAALLSKGRGIGWGDAKLAAVAGAVIGASNALLACAFAAFAAVAASKFEPGAAGRPIAFAPYIIAATAVFTAWSAVS